MKHVDFSSLSPPAGRGEAAALPRTREQSSAAAAALAGPCLCSVCDIGRLNGHDYNQFKERVTEPVGRPRIYPPTAEPQPIRLCSLCFNAWGPGKTHECNRETKRDNVEELVRNTSRLSKERIMSSQLKEVFEDQGASTSGGTVRLTTGGTPILASLGQAQPKPGPKFDNEALNRLQLKMGESDNKMKILDNFLRVHCGRSSVHLHEEYMIERNQMLKEFFGHKKITQVEYVKEKANSKETEKKKKKKKETREVEKTVAYAKDVEVLAQVVMEERNLDPDNVVVQIGIDDGQGLVKIMMSIKEKDAEEPKAKKKKSKYSDGFAPKEFQNSGVKKLILILLSPTTERHDNIASLLRLLDIQAIDFGYCCDLKMVLFLLGKQSASSKHCCPFCTGSSPWLGVYSSVTVGSLWKNYNAFQEAGANIKNAMNYNNVVNRPLVTGKDDQKILGDLVFFPEHHVFTGIVGKLVKELERNVFESPEEGLNFMDEWMAERGVNVSRTVYHGSASFIGNQAERLLAKADLLQLKLRNSNLNPDKLALAEMYVKALKQFDKVVHSCFGQTLKPGYKLAIQQFMVTYRYKISLLHCTNSLYSQF
jgi:hypothetical protein